MRDVLPQIEQWRAEGKAVALATVVSVAGSAPRGVGAKLVVTDTGEMAGSVSGGCVENAVIETGLEVLASGQSQLVRYGVSDEDAWEVGLACGGTIEVLIEKVGDGLCVVGGAEVVGGGVYVGVGAGRLPFAAISWWLGNFSCGLPAR